MRTIRLLFLNWFSCWKETGLPLKEKACIMILQYSAHGLLQEKFQ